MAVVRCKSCLKETEAAVCPYCGYPENPQNESHQLPVGTLLRRRYQLGKVLGQGGFGITYLAWDTLMRKAVAVKEFYPRGTVFRRTTTSFAVECGAEGDIPHYEFSRERFLREASALVDFREIPEVVDILDFVEENNTAYIVMEFVRGVDLAKYIRRKGGCLCVEETFRILRPVMEALAKVHKGGIVHRDISPDNIILDPLGGAKLLDFGAVRTVENPDMEQGLTKSTEAILKHGFAPMEQYNSRGSLGPWTDEYAMCATVWYCLTGRTPEEATMRLTEGIDPDWSSIPGLPRHQQKALEKGFSLRPRDRYPDMDSLLADLFPAETKEVPKKEDPEREEPKQTAVPAPSQPEPALKEKPRWQKKWLIPAAGIAAVLAVAALLMSPRLPASRYIPETVSAGGYHTVALKADGTVVAVGSNSSGQREVTAWQDIVAVSAGSDHTVGLKSNGTAVAAGSNEYGQCDVSDWQDIVVISAGDNHTVGLKADGTVVAVGINEYGQCDVSDWQDIVAISSGDDHTVGLKADGTVVAVGLNEYGRCDVSDWQDIVTIGAGSRHTVGLKADGTVVAVGNNGYGQCDISHWQDIVAVSAGFNNTIGLKADGTVMAVGADGYGRCKVSDWQDIVAISAGSDHTVGLKANGTAVAVGNNCVGQCDVSGWQDIRVPE